MHSIKQAAAGLLVGGLCPDSGPGAAALPPERPAHDTPPSRRSRSHPRRRAVEAWRSGTIPTLDQKRLAVVQLRKAFGRIDADFSEAYEQCRNDAQRRALELAHRKARQAFLRALQEHLLEDRDGWRLAEAKFQPDKARADRDLTRLATAGAVVRILKRLTVVEAQLAVLAA